MPMTLIKSDARSREKPCLRCGYSLRKLGDSTHCPECGLSVWLSLNPNDALDWSSPQWLWRMMIGLWVMAAAVLPGAIAAAITGWHSLQKWLWQDDIHAQLRNGIPSTAPLNITPPPTISSETLLIVQLMTAAFLAIYHVGLLLLTWNEERYPDRQKTVRLLSWIAAGTGGLTALLTAGVMVNPRIAPLWGLLVRLVLVGSVLITLAWVRHLAHRMMKSTLAKLCGWLMFLPAIGLLKAFPCVGAVLVMHFSWVIDFLPAVYLPAGAVLFIWLSLMLRKAAVEAEKNWAKETAS